MRQNKGPIFFKLFEIIPNADHLLSLEPEVLAGALLISLDGAQDINPGGIISLRAMSSALKGDLEQKYPFGCRDKVLFALMEAWQWLEREGFVAPRPTDLTEGMDYGKTTQYFVTRRGQRIETPDALEVYRKGNLLPKAQLHPIIAQKVWAMFLQGNYAPAVLQAFKEVEIAVRKAGKYAESNHGVPLMRQAFHVDTGKLTDTNQQPAEQEAIGHLFAGAIGYCRNPLGHREVNLSAEEAVEMIFLASYLLRIVDSRTPSEES